MDEATLQTIELDCPPGWPRPGDLIDGVIAGTGLPHRSAVSRVFGNWMWQYEDVPKEVWDKANPIVRQRIEELYRQGLVRYASW